MKVFLAGASGAVGRRLLPLLVGAGHHVVGTTRSDHSAEAIRAAGGEAAVLDVTDLDSLRREVHRAEPEVVVNQLTSLPAAINYRDPETFTATIRLRREVGPVLIQAAADAGAHRAISQSIAFFYAPGDAELRREEDPLMEPPAGSTSADSVGSVRQLERATLETDGVQGIVLRYGYFYGPGTWFAADGSSAEQVRKRRFPIVGGGEGVFSWLHVDDAATATVAALEQGRPGIYNVVDDDPAPVGEWLPLYAEALGAKPPRRAPTWLARLVAGGDAAQMLTRMQGASNAKAKRGLGWQPKYPSWRQGFREALG